MRVGILKIAACVAVALTAGVASAGDDVLYWMVGSDATVEKDGVTTSVSSFFENYGAPQDSAFAARVRVTGGNIQEGQDVFLDLYIPGYGLDVGGGEYGVEFSEVGGYWGAGVPTGNQSPSNIDSSDNWTTVATSAAATYSSLGNYIHQTFDINPGQIAVWAPTAFSVPVPEPSSGLLTLIGFAFLALRRKRKEA